MDYITEITIETTLSGKKSGKNFCQQIFPRLILVTNVSELRVFNCTFL